MAKRFQLDAQADNDFLIFGISSHQKDYRLCHHINKNLFLDLVKKDDLEAEIRPRQKPVSFSFYTFEDSDNYITFYFIANKNQDGVLIPEIKQVDYLLLISGPFSKESQDRFQKTLKTLPGVLAIFLIDITKPKNINALITELELHLVSKEKNKSGHPS